MRVLDRTWRDLYFTSRDGLRLHVRHYPAPGSPRRPLICLPGLTRNARDFHDLGVYLSDPARHRRAVYAIDYRGRGLSQWDANVSNYSIFMETLDVVEFMTVHGLADAAVLGSSHGGLVAMALATLRPTAIGAAILNDIGPVVERDGYVRLLAYIGRTPLPATWEDAAALVRAAMTAHFPDVPEAQWAEVARQIYNDENGLPAPGYDPRLGRAVSLVDGVVPPLWSQFRALHRVPTMVIHGQNSDVLTLSTLAEMQTDHPDLTAITVRGQGHAPLLKDQWTMEAIAKFLINEDVAALERR
jgi:pimeloyl-ACP methyl ester carboxylesterase